MDNNLSTQEQSLCEHLITLPRRHKYRYADAANSDLLYNLFWSLAGGRPEYLRLFFPDGNLSLRNLKLRAAQGAVDGAEYTEAARGSACGHIFRAGEASYHCRTCAADETCCLCSHCFNATDHTGHMVRISISPGNSGCCDCGDLEAWKRPMFCTIHSEHSGKFKGKGKETALPEDLVNHIRITIARVLDFVCDVISCAPEQLRQPKTRESIELDEERSRLSSVYCGGDVDCPDEWAVLLWNDEKHTVEEVKSQVARACSTTAREGYNAAVETDHIGRSILVYSDDIGKLLKIAKILEQIKVTVTIRSSRDTFREQMCGSIVGWLNDIAGCLVGSDGSILRQVICQELLRPWRKGSSGAHKLPGRSEIDDEEDLEQVHAKNEAARMFIHRGGLLAEMDTRANAPTTLAEFLDDSDDDMAGNQTPTSEEEDDDNENDDDDGDDDDEEEEEDGDVVMLDTGPGNTGDVSMSDWRPDVVDDALEQEEATMAGYPPPPPPPAVITRRTTRDRDLTPSDSDTAEPLIAPTVYAKTNLEISKTPGLHRPDQTNPPRPGRYWVETPEAYLQSSRDQPFEDVFERVRLDWLVLFDLRMWKKVRNDLRSLYISTVVSIPEFKRVLGLRFAALYTTLAQLYLIADREPDHSIINISLQMLTTPTITAEVVERGNFLTTLMAILYTFLTTRQVGHPWEVSSSAVLGFDTGSVTNRRMYHFYVDLRYLLSSPHVQTRIRTEERYLLQFLDLIKLHQGICPNIRAVGDHVEYETDSWIGASLMTREINKLCRLLSDSFRNVPEHESHYVARAIRLTAKNVIINSIGAERFRFTLTEIKDEVRFKTVTDFEFARPHSSFDVVRFVIDEQAISFHHAMHYTLSWLIECGKNMPLQQLVSVLSFTTQELKMKPKSMGRKTMPKKDYAPEDYLLAVFDFPLRVCSWLAQIKAGMWVRNGISLRHQALTYRNILHRDVAHHRDIFLLQTALVICEPNRMLASVVDRFGMDKWIKGFFEQTLQAQDETQHLDVVEDMLHLLIVILSDRVSLVPVQNELETHLMAMRRDVAHVLCFRPLSYNEICNKLPDKFHEQEDFPRVLEEVATFKSPEGVSDVGTFELKPQWVEDIDPYIAHYNKNQREESELAYRKWTAKRTGKKIEDVVFEPKLRPISSGAFAGLANFTGCGMFAQIIYYCLLYPLVANKFTPKVPFTRVEAFLQLVLHLVLIAIIEDKSDGTDCGNSFVYRALTSQARSNFIQDAPTSKTIVSLLELISTKDELKVCHPKVALILRRMRQKMPHHFDAACERLGIPVDRINTASPASAQNANEERERKKQAALARQAKVMAQFQQQQKSFLEMQGDMDWGEEESEEMEERLAEERKNFRKYPRGTCILCQEETDDERLYGTFGLFMDSHILRQTDLHDADFVREVANTPNNLDRSAEDIRPFGLARENRHEVQKVNSEGEVFAEEKSCLGKGFPSKLVRPGPVAVSCGHTMHFGCFEMYIEATSRRHVQQIARHHPESLERLEFVCPLCKALGNSFLPIAWDGKEESYPGVLHNPITMEKFLSMHSRSGSPWLTQFDGGAAKRLFTDYLRDRIPRIFGETAERPFMNTRDSTPSGTGSSIASRAMSSSTSFTESFSAVATPESSSRSRSPAEVPDNERALRKIYRRLRDSLRYNRLCTKEPDDKDEDLYGSSTLARSVGYSISATEIQQRGLEADYDMTLITRIPEQTLVHLRVLSETVSTYIAIGALQNNCEVNLGHQFRTASDRQNSQLFISEFVNNTTVSGHTPMSTYPPLLGEDPFIFLCESVFGIAWAEDMDINSLVKLCYLAELVKVVFLISCTMPAPTWFRHISDGLTDGGAVNNFASFCQFISQTRPDGKTSDFDLPGIGFDQTCVNSISKIHTFIQKYALVFLRKTAILLHVHYGVDLNSHTSVAPDADELTRLSTALRVPSINAMYAAVTALAPSCGWPSETKALVRGWIIHRFHWSAQSERQSLPLSAQLSHPGIFELVGLPKHFDSLIDECARRRCRTTGKDLADPIVCLLCGEIFCGQTMCCLMDVKDSGPGGERPNMQIGSAQQHMRFRCQGNFGLFMNIRKCAIFYLHRVSGSYSNAPYIDKYGEVDLGLRHGRQLSLNQRRYDSMIRAIWLSHGVPSFISRKLEADINNGGWETI